MLMTCSVIQHAFKLNIKNTKIQSTGINEVSGERTSASELNCISEYQILDSILNKDNDNLLRRMFLVTTGAMVGNVFVRQQITAETSSPRQLTRHDSNSSLWKFRIVSAFF